LRFSPDGKRLVAADAEGVVAVWDVATGKRVTTIETGDWQRQFIHAVSADFLTLFVPHAKYDVKAVEKDGKEVRQWDCEGSIRAWDLATGKLQRTYQHKTGRAPLLIDLSPDGTQFLSYEMLSGTYAGQPETAASLWDVKSGQPRPMPLGRGSFANDGRTVALAVGDKGDRFATAIKVLNTATLKESLSIPIKQKSASVSSLRFSPDGMLLVGEIHEQGQKRGESQSWIVWWDAKTGQEVASFAADKDDHLTSPQFSPAGQTLAATTSAGNTTRRADQCKLILFRVKDRQKLKPVVVVASLKKEPGTVSDPVFSPDSNWVVIITSGSRWARSGDRADVRDAPQPRIHLVDVASGQIRATLVAPQCFATTSACFSPDGSTLATDGHGRVLLWNVAEFTKAGARNR
jgi:WD40 repeat protein